MTLGVLIVLILLGIAFQSHARRRTARTLWIFAALLLALASSGILPTWLLGHLQGPYAKRPSIAWASRNAIVLLGAGTVRVPGETVEPSLFANGRINEALALYRECRQTGNDCKLEVSGGDAQHHGASEAAAYGAELFQLGVPPGDLMLEPHSMNTWQNAQFSAPLLRGYGTQRVVLVSSAVHLRRACLYFAHFGVSVIPVRGDWVRVQHLWWPQAWNLVLTDLALHEYIGVWRYHVYNAMGWNVKATKPGAY